MHKIAISVGDLNGIGIEIALKAHAQIQKLCQPLYCIGEEMLEKVVTALKVSIPDDFEMDLIPGNYDLKAGCVDARSGLYSFLSFTQAIQRCRDSQASAMVTLPINKESWSLAQIPYRGHTDALRDIFKKEAIMVMGCEKMYVALYTDHIPLKDICLYIQTEPLVRFLLDLHRESGFENVAVLGLNPHAGDGGVLGCDDTHIEEAIALANEKLGKEIYKGPFVPDTAFTPQMRSRYRVYVAMYHDQGLIPLKSHYFDESVNISLNLPIIRTSVDHGTAFDIAYKDANPSTTSYINAIKAAVMLAERKMLA